ncbi:MAG: hypothetical protein LBG99_09395 [Propionibacteriaceae bacterium]|jgi:hypothetical protein|nr:hypothetical protein [Propionibacteriaceae bacterium]
MNLNSLLRSIAGVLCAVGLVCSLGGCTTDRYALPTLGGKPKEQGSELVEAAKLYYDCMTEAGIEVQLSQNSEGKLTMAFFAIEDGFILQSNEGSGSASFSGEMTPEQDKMMNDFFENTGDGPRLSINGVDHSEIYAHCLEISGYDENAAYGNDSYMMDPAEAERMVRANNEWAACARENGFPGVNDSAMPSKMDGSEWPAILLPGTITPDQLRALLEVCTNFDPELEEARNKYWEENPMASSLPDDMLPDPSIQFDFGEGFAEGPDAQAEEEQMRQMYDILYEKMYEYWEEKER